MFKYTCPTCLTSRTEATIRNGMLTVCAGCRQQLRVVLESDTEAPPPPKRSAWWASPWLVAICASSGMGVAAAVLLLWGSLSRSPATPDTRTVATVAPEKPSDNKLATTVPSSAPAVQVAQSKGAEPVKGNSPAPGNDLELTGDQVYTKLIRSCVWIVATDGKKRRREDGTIVTSQWFGSGSVVDSGERLVITNEHVANESCVSIQVVFPDFNPRTGDVIGERSHYQEKLAQGKFVTAHLVKGSVDKKRDLALIQLDRIDPGVQPVRIAARSPKPGQTVHVVGGTPRGSQGQWIHSDGSVRQVSFAQWQYEDGFPRSAMVIDSQAATNPGDSGAPVVDTRCRLVGVHAMGGSGLANVGHIDVSEVRDLLRKYFHRIGKDWKEPVDDTPSASPSAEVADLLRGLDGADPTRREAAATRLGAIGPDAQAAVPRLLHLLRNPDELNPVREAVEKALAAIGAPHKNELPLLMEALADPKFPQARRYAADSLSRMGDDARPAASALIRALEDEDAAVRRAALVTLGQLGPIVLDQAHAAVMARLTDTEADVRKAALGTLLRVGKAVDAAALRAMLANQATVPEPRVYAIWSLLEYGADSTPAFIDALANDKDPWVARVAAVSLGLLNNRTKEAAEALTRAIDHKERQVRVAAGEALTRLGFDAYTLPGILRALSLDDADMRKAAWQALPNFSAFLKDKPTLNLSLTDDVRDALKGALASPDPLARLFAVFAIGSLGPDGATAAPELRTLLLREKMTHPKLSPYIRLETLATFEQLGPAALKALGKDADRFLDELKVIASDTDESTRLLQTAAAIALVKLAPKKIQDPQDDKPLRTLAKAMRLHDFQKPDHDPIEDELHERAKKALVQTGRPAAVPLAQTCLAMYFPNRDRAGRDTDAEVLRAEKAYARKCTFQVLELIGPPARFDAVQRAIDRSRLQAYAPDEFPDVKAAAKAAYFAIWGK